MTYESDLVEVWPDHDKQELRPHSEPCVPCSESDCDTEDDSDFQELCSRRDAFVAQCMGRLA